MTVETRADGKALSSPYEELLIPVLGISFSYGDGLGVRFQNRHFQGVFGRAGEAPVLNQ
jgi:hypothetical protein